VALATAATVIASQAVIAGAFSLTHQAVQLNYLPRLEVRHTSAQTYGQIYVPWVNWALMTGVLILVFAFRSSNALAYAFGMAVTVTITITTILFFYLAREQWRKPWWLVIGGASVFLLLEGLFLAANLTKFAHGAYLPLAIGLVFFTIMMTWQRGRQLVTRRREHDEGSLRHFVDTLPNRYPHLRRVAGTAVFLNRTKRTTPLAMRANVEHNHILHSRVIIVSVHTMPVPYLDDSQRLIYDDLGSHDGIAHLDARYGYMEKPNLPALLQLASDEHLEAALDLQATTYFLSTIDLQIADAPGLARWRKHLFLATSRVTADAAEYFGLPRDRTVIMGAVINL
jgi:KUP system potassium uptake protein